MKTESKREMRERLAMELDEKQRELKNAKQTRSSGLDAYVGRVQLAKDELAKAK
jgi:hypothetical protein